MGDPSDHHLSGVYGHGRSVIAKWYSSWFEVSKVDVKAISILLPAHVVYIHAGHVLLGATSDLPSMIDNPGTIPRELGDIKLLESLNVSRYQLTGEPPVPTTYF